TLDSLSASASSFAGTSNIASVKKKTINAQALFKLKCSTCHGQKAQNRALGKSQIIAKWDKQKLINTLKGYKKGVYGGNMKSVMQNQVNQLNDDEIIALANYISKL
ncbi:MAG: c-type cytochrome, partial [Campylobacteraceae bacterium]|nr:c-type cytochrome [Campylobacteraceae bacterium]